MKFSYLVISITVVIVLSISSLVIFLSDKGEQRIGNMATFRKNLLHLEPSQRKKEVNFLDGKRLERTLSFFFLCGGVLLILITLFVKFPIPVRLILIVLFGAISFLAYKNLNKINTLVNVREQVYRNGKPVSATVISQTKKSVFYTSTPLYGVTVKTNDTQQKTLTFYFSSKMLHNSCPIGTTINGAEYNGDYFFGQMVGINFAFANENGEIRTQN